MTTIVQGEPYFVSEVKVYIYILVHFNDGMNDLWLFLSF